jgi:hypothetical protein
VARLGPRQWDVTQAFVWQYVPGSVPPGATTPGPGFVLAGGLHYEQLPGEDSASCMSTFSNVRLD